MHTQYWRIVRGLVLCAVAIAGCIPNQPVVIEVTPTQPEQIATSTDEVYWPTQGWRSSAPEEQGMDAALLQDMFTVINDQHLNIHGIVVVRNGYIVAEGYYPPFDQSTPHAIYSCTKSFMSALIGIALEEGLISGLDQDVLGLFPELSFDNVNTAKESMTLAYLLTMQSGLVWEDGIPTYDEMGRHRDLIHYVLDRPMAGDPGSDFNYCSGCSHLLSIIIQRVAAEGTLTYAQNHLFDPLGITDVIWIHDRQGYPNGNLLNCRPQGNRGIPAPG